MNTYANAEAIRAKGENPTPQVGDRVDYGFGDAPDGVGEVYSLAGFDASKWRLCRRGSLTFEEDD